MKTKIFSIAIIAILLVSTVSFAQPGKRGQQWNNDSKQKAMMMKKHRAIQKGDRQNFLNDKQKEAIKALHLETAKTVKPLKNELRELAAHQKTLTAADNADLKAINKNIDKMAEIKAEVAKIIAAQHQQVRSLLTEEQLLKFDAMKANRGKGQRGDFRPQRMRSGENHRFGTGA